MPLVAGEARNSRLLSDVLGSACCSSSDWRERTRTLHPSMRGGVGKSTQVRALAQALRERGNRPYRHPANPAVARCAEKIPSSC